MLLILHFVIFHKGIFSQFSFINSQALQYSHMDQYYPWNLTFGAKFIDSPTNFCFQPASIFIFGNSLLLLLSVFYIYILTVLDDSKCHLWSDIIFLFEKILLSQLSEFLFTSPPSPIKSAKFQVHICFANQIR